MGHQLQNEELVSILLSNGGQLPPRPLEEAVYSRCSKYIVEMILDAGADIKKYPFEGEPKQYLDTSSRRKTEN